MVCVLSRLDELPGVVIDTKHGHVSGVAMLLENFEYLILGNAGGPPDALGSKEHIDRQEPLASG